MARSGHANAATAICWQAAEQYGRSARQAIQTNQQKAACLCVSPTSCATTQLRQQGCEPTAAAILCRAF